MIQKITELVGAVIFGIYCAILFIVAIVLALSKSIWQYIFNDSDYEN